MNGFWWKKSLENFLGAVIMALLLFLLIAASAHYGISNLLGLTTLALAAIACCKTLFSFCLVSPTMFKAVIPWVGFGIVTFGLILAVFRAGRGLIISRRFLSVLHAVSTDKFPKLKSLADDNKTVIIPFEDQGLKSAFTLGIFKPKVYISTELIDQLTEGELRAATFHEIHHVKNKDPLKIFILSFIKDLFFFLPLGRHFADMFCMTKELAADETAVSITGKPLDLAQAILKIIKTNERTTSVGVQLLEKESFVEKRFKEIFEREHVNHNKRLLKIVLGSMIVVPMLVTALALPINAETRQMAKCNHSYCLGSNNVCPSHFDECQKACDLMESG